MVPRSLPWPFWIPITVASASWNFLTLRTAVHHLYSYFPFGSRRIIPSPFFAITFSTSCSRWALDLTFLWGWIWRYSDPRVLNIFLSFVILTSKSPLRHGPSKTMYLICFQPSCGSFFLTILIVAENSPLSRKSSPSRIQFFGNLSVKNLGAAKILPYQE